jgi:hypothetical protein
VGGAHEGDRTLLTGSTIQPLLQMRTWAKGSRGRLPKRGPSIQSTTPARFRRISCQTTGAGWRKPAQADSPGSSERGGAPENRTPISRSKAGGSSLELVPRWSSFACWCGFPASPPRRSTEAELVTVASHDILVSGRTIPVHCALISLRGAKCKEAVSATERRLLASQMLCKSAVYAKASSGILDARHGACAQAGLHCAVSGAAGVGQRREAPIPSPGYGLI